mmetsp:Transcript_33849/g.83169  ORF Transcript_33849/g.83169 Transcript_33849/m.83169 type:complete len:341 (+) Transcript_33849:358-1380(+)
MAHNATADELMVAEDPTYEVDLAFARFTANVRPLLPAGEEIRNLVGAMKGVSLMLHVCEHSRSADAVDDAVVSLYELCASPVAVEELVVLGGLQVLIDLLLDVARSRKVHSHTLLLLLRMLVTDELKTAVIELGVTAALVRLIKSDNTVLVQRSLQVTRECCSVESNVEYFKSLGEELVHPLLQLCERNFDPIIIDFSAELLKDLVSSQEQRETYIRLNAVSALLRILSHCNQVSAKEHSMATMRILCEDPSIRRIILERGGLAPLVLATHHGETLEIRRHAGVVLAEISVSDSMQRELENLEAGNVFAHLDKDKKKKRGSLLGLSLTPRSPRMPRTPRK